MVHLSRFQLPDETLKKIFNLFIQVVGDRNDKQEFEKILVELVSLPERIMIAKRLGIIYLLQKNIGVINICYALKVSKSTVYKYAMNKNSNTVNVLNHTVRTEKFYRFFENIFDSLYDDPGVPGHNWKVGWEHRIKKQKEKTFGI